MANDASSDPALTIAVNDSVASVSINLSSNTLTLTPSTGSPSSFDLTSSSYDTLAELAAAIDALSYVACEVSAADSTTPSTLMNGVSAASVSADDTYILTYTNTTAASYSSLITSLIGEVEQAFEDACGVDSFESDDYTERYDGMGSPYIALRNTPVTSVTSVAIIAPDESSTTLAASDYYIEASAGILHRRADSLSEYGWTSYLGEGPAMNRDRLPKWPEGRQNVSVVYTGGHATIPDSLTAAATRVVTAMFLDRTRNPLLASDAVDKRTRTAGAMSVRDYVLSEAAPWMRSVVVV